MTIDTLRRHMNSLLKDKSGAVDVVIYDFPNQKSVNFTAKKLKGDISGEALPSMLVDCTSEDGIPVSVYDFSKVIKNLDQNATINVQVDVTGSNVDDGSGVIIRAITGIAVYKEVINDTILTKLILKAPLSTDSTF